MFWPRILRHRYSMVPRIATAAATTTKSDCGSITSRAMGAEIIWSMTKANQVVWTVRLHSSSSAISTPIPSMAMEGGMRSRSWSAILALRKDRSPPASEEGKRQRSLAKPTSGIAVTQPTTREISTTRIPATFESTMFCPPPRAVSSKAEFTGLRSRTLLRQTNSSKPQTTASFGSMWSYTKGCRSTVRTAWLESVFLESEPHVSTTS